MLDVFSLANARIAVELNHSLFAHPPLFKLALFLAESGANLLILLTLTALWFASSSKHPPESTPEFGHAFGPSEMRIANRARVLTVVAAAMLAYLVARLLAERIDIDRPFATFLPIVGPRGIFNGLRTYGSFPSDHAALLGALGAALWFWDRRFAWAWAVPAIVLAVARIAVGHHYPFDMVAGAALGAMITFYTLRAQARAGTFQTLTQSIARSFERKNTPFHYLSYALLLLLAIEFSSHFRHVLDALQNARGDVSTEYSEAGRRT